MRFLCCDSSYCRRLVASLADFSFFAADLESTMRSIEGLLGHHDLVEREEGLIKAG